MENTRESDHNRRMAGFKNYYQVLGVEAFADSATVKAAFRKLARQFHPDLNGGNAQAEERFKEINEAYETLNNPDRRALHDASLSALNTASTAKADPKKGKSPESGNPSVGKKAEPQSKPGGHHTSTKPDKANKGQATSINDLFESFLKKGFQDKSNKEKANQSKPAEEDGIFWKASQATSAGNEPAKRGEDVTVKTAITPQEATDGVVKTVNVQHNEICRRCSGMGKVNGNNCMACNGEKFLVRIKKIDVRIPAGVKAGSKVRVAKEGGKGQGGADNGDLFLQIEIAYDPSMRIEGLDVYAGVPLSVTDAVLGSEIEVQTLSGPVKMTIPPGTQTGRVFRLKERGVQAGLSRGDHLVTVVIVTPENLSAREKALYQELAALRPEKPNLKKSKSTL